MGYFFGLRTTGKTQDIFVEHGVLFRAVHSGRVFSVRHFCFDGKHTARPHGYIGPRGSICRRREMS